MHRENLENNINKLQLWKNERIWTNSGTQLTRSGDGKMSPIKEMSYLQSRMHFDESMESNADSDLEDGEIRKLLTSSLCAQGARKER